MKYIIIRMKNAESGSTVNSAELGRDEGDRLVGRLTKERTMLRKHI